MARPVISAAIASVLLAAPAAAQDNKPKEELADRVNASIDKGIRYLKQQQRPGGDWERGAQLAGIAGTSGGPTCLALLALLNAGVKPDDPVVAEGLKYLRANPPATVGYEGVKRALAGLRPDDTDAYLAVKDPVCDIIMVGAELWAAATRWSPGPSDA